MTVFLEYYFYRDIKQQTSDGKEIIVEKMKQMDKAFQEYVQIPAIQREHSEWGKAASQNLNKSILDFSMVSFLTFDCETKRTPEQIKDRFNEIKEVQTIYQKKGIDLEYDTIMMKNSTNPMPYPQDMMSEFQKQRYKNIAEKFLLLSSEEKQKFFQEIMCVTHHKDTVKSPSKKVKECFVEER